MSSEQLTLFPDLNLNRVHECGNRQAIQPVSLPGRKDLAGALLFSAGCITALPARCTSSDRLRAAQLLA